MSEAHPFVTTPQLVKMGGYGDPESIKRFLIDLSAAHHKTRDFESISLAFNNGDSKSHQQKPEVNDEASVKLLPKTENQND